LIKNINGRLIAISVAISVLPVLASCGKSGFSESEIYTLYSSNYPTLDGRSGVATFDLATEMPELNGSICEETAAALQAEFKRSEKAKGKSGQMRY
jgi:hypothetical protein